jgi:carbon-monoxide dehydrogenase medium subunit
VAVKIPKRSPTTRYGYWKFCRKAGEFAQAIGAALHDPDSKEWRAVIGAVEGPPYLLKNNQPAEDAVRAAGIGDAYSRRLHAVALKRAVSQIVQ